MAAATRDDFFSRIVLCFVCVWCIPIVKVLFVGVRFTRMPGACFSHALNF